MNVDQVGEQNVNAEEAKVEEEKKEEQKTAKKPRRSKKEEAQAAKEEDLNGIYYFSEPVKVTDLWSDDDPNLRKIISKVEASGNYCYALELNDSSNQLYSWGMGSSYVLGNREEDNEFHAFIVNPKMYEELPVQQVACGT